MKQYIPNGLSNFETKGVNSFLIIYHDYQPTVEGRFQKTHNFL